MNILSGMTNWPEGTIRVEHVNITLYLIPVIDGIEVNTESPFHVSYDQTNLLHEVHFFELERPEPSY